MASIVIKIEMDSEYLDRTLGNLKEHLPDYPREFIDRLIGLIQVPGEFIRLESRTTNGAIKITIHPSDRLLELIATA